MRRSGLQLGETVVALIDETEATLKKFYKEGGKVKLQPANSERSLACWIRTASAFRAS